MRKLITILLALLLTSSAFAQLELDKAGQQLLDSLKIKYDPNDPDATLKLEQQLKDKFIAKYDSVMKVAGNEVSDPNNTEGLIADILGEFGEGDDTIST